MKTATASSIQEAIALKARDPSIEAWDLSYFQFASIANEGRAALYVGHELQGKKTLLSLPVIMRTPHEAR